METFQSQEKNYGDELGMIKRAPISTTQHPLETIEKNCKETKEKLDLEKARRNFGIGFSLHLQHERAVTGCADVGHLPFLKRHNVLHQSLMGQDLDIDFSDVLNIEPEFNKTPFVTMENPKNKMFFRNY